jgi:hypothetical protein
MIWRYLEASNTYIRDAGWLDVLYLRAQVRRRDEKRALRVADKEQQIVMWRYPGVCRRKKYAAG